jgi:hypothetical protein
MFGVRTRPRANEACARADQCPLSVGGRADTLAWVRTDGVCARRANICG